MEKMRKFAPGVVRLGIALVILWFGIQQFLDPESWTMLIPSWATGISGFEAVTLVWINGSSEIIIGLLLLLGVFTRLVALLSSFHLLLITFVVGYNSVGVRDFGLSMGAISTFLYGVDAWCLDTYFLSKRTNALQTS